MKDNNKNATAEDTSKMEEDELEKFLASEKSFNQFKRKKKENKRSAEEMTFRVEEVIAMLEVAAEEDALLNTQGKPCIHKLKKLPLLVEALSKIQLQKQFLSRGILSVLKIWLEPLPDGSMPNVAIREAILNSLTNFRMDLSSFHVKEQLKNSRLGKAIMFMSKSNEETASNRKLAKDLVNKWSCAIFKKSTDFTDLRGYIRNESICTNRRPPMKKDKKSSSKPNSKVDVLKPEKSSMVFAVRPQSKKIDQPAMVAHRNKTRQNERCDEIVKKLKRVNEGNRFKKRSLQRPLL